MKHIGPNKLWTLIQSFKKDPNCENDILSIIFPYDIRFLYKTKTILIPSQTPIKEFVPFIQRLRITEPILRCQKLKLIDNVLELKLFVPKYVIHVHIMEYFIVDDGVGCHIFKAKEFECMDEIHEYIFKLFEKYTIVGDEIYESYNDFLKTCIFDNPIGYSVYSLENKCFVEMELPHELFDRFALKFNE
jgi:hypothetical protein